MKMLKQIVAVIAIMFFVAVIGPFYSVLAFNWFTGMSVTIQGLGDGAVFLYIVHIFFAAILSFAVWDIIENEGL